MPKASTPSRCSATTPDARPSGIRFDEVMDHLGDSRSHGGATRSPRHSPIRSPPRIGLCRRSTEPSVRIATTDRCGSRYPYFDRQLLHRQAARACRDALLRVIRRRARRRRCRIGDDGAVDVRLRGARRGTLAGCVRSRQTQVTTLWEERGYGLNTWNGRYAMALVAANRGDRSSHARRSARFRCSSGQRLATSTSLGALGQSRARRGSPPRRIRLRGGLSPESLVITDPATFRTHTPQVLWSALDLRRRRRPLRSVRRGQVAHVTAMNAANLGRTLATACGRHHGLHLAMTASDDAAPATLHQGTLPMPGIESWPFEFEPGCTSLYGERLRRLRRAKDSRAAAP